MLLCTFSDGSVLATSSISGVIFSPPCFGFDRILVAINTTKQRENSDIERGFYPNRHIVTPQVAERVNSHRLMNKLFPDCKIPTADRQLSDR
jgi:hypothetical protein